MALTLRCAVALVLLSAQLAGALHLLLVEHGTSDSGEAVDVSPRCARDAAGADGFAHGHDVAHDDHACEVVAFARVSSDGPVELAPLHAVEATWRVTVGRLADAVPPLEVLSVAPKSSPPG